MENSHLEGTGIALRLSPDEALLLAVFTPLTNRRALQSEELHKAIAAQGYGELFISEDALSELIKRCVVTPIGFTLQIGERRDSSFAMQLSEDHMAVTLTIHQGYGGKRVTREEVLGELSGLGVVTGILYGEIDAALEAGRCSKLQIAAGLLPVPGEDSQFISLIPMSEVPQFADDETADYRNLGDIVSVSLGDPLMRRSHPTLGVPGSDLLGRELPTSDGCEIPFAENLDGVAFDPNDPDLLIAALSGYPVALKNGVTVDPVFKLKRVDLSTGHLRFKGSLEIAGDVCGGMEVTATEGITVGGVVEAARLKAGGDIEIKGGVIGHVKLGQEKTESRQGAAQLEAGGSITVQFAENAVINAGQDIVVRELAMLSELTAGATIRVGEQGSRKGHIIGGRCRAATLVHAVVIGSHAGVPTLIEVGFDPALNRKLEAVKDTLADKGRLMEELTKTLAYVKENPGSMEPGLFKRKVRVYAKYQGEIAELTGEKKRLQKRMEINAQARIEVERDTFLGAQIKIGEFQLHLEDDLLGPTFTLTEEGITYSC